MNRQLSLSLVLALASGSAVAQVDWSLLSANAAPDPYCGSAWDADRNRLVAFGGAIGPTQSQETREWDGVSWSNLNPFPRPSVRTRPAMAFDGARGVTVLFGGGTAFNNETWTWDGTTWTQQFPATSPTGRFGAAMAYDSDRQVVVMFGGFVPSGLDTGEVWEWDGANWTPRIIVGLQPQPRGAHRMVYDAARQATLVCGGYSTPGLTTLADTWSWDGASWTQGPSLPGSVCDQVLAYDPTRQRVVLQGGLRIQGANFTDLDQTYEWDGTWTQRPTGTTAGARNGSACGFNDVANRVISAGGTNTLGSVLRSTFGMSPVTPGSESTFGQACVVTQGIDLRSQSLPYIGSPFVHEIYNASPVAQIALLIFGGSNTAWGTAPLPADLNAIGAPGCSLLVSFDAPQALLLVNGEASITWNIPNTLSAVGATIYTQGFALDPSSPLPFAIDMSTGRALTIGSP